MTRAGDHPGWAVTSMIANRSPSVSVIVPVYNVARLLPGCLDSLLQQSFGDFEVVAVDDGSTDGSTTILSEYEREHPDLIRMLRKPNGGLGDARNFGIDRARGEYLAFVDSDDTVAPEFLERMYHAARTQDADLVVCGIRNFSDDGALDAYIPEPEMDVFGHSLAEEPRLLYRVDASACNKLFARELFGDARFPVGTAFEDLPTVYGILRYARRVAKVDAPLYNYRRAREESISSGYGREYLQLIEVMGALDDSYVSSGHFDANRNALLRLNLTHLIAGRYPDLFLRARGPVRREFISSAFRLLGSRFPGWQRSRVPGELWKNVVLRAISTNSGILQMFTSLPRRAYLAVLTRIGAFDPRR